jgi:hypothetical protein
MTDSLRCPFCGWTGAARRIENVEAPLAGTSPADRDRPAGEPDKFECEVCRQVWVDDADPAAGRPRTADTRARSK